MEKPVAMLFIHRSVGFYLIRDGKLRQLLKSSTHSVTFNDYNQNTDILTDSSGQSSSKHFVFPGNDTKPADYAKIFSHQPISDSAAEILQFILRYDLIVIKSCYPNNNIKNQAGLEALQQAYLSIADYFQSQPTKKLVILTSPPLTPLMTTPAKARRARQLATWLATTDLGANVSVFNFFELLASPRGWLRLRYRRLLPIDSHPNRRANKAIAPKLARYLQELP